MSSKGAGALAVLREQATHPGERVTQAELGKASASNPDASSFLDALSTVVPTGIIAGYSTLLAAVLQAIAKPTKEDPHPDQLVELRIILWALFAVLAFYLAMRSYQPPAGTERRRQVPLEVTVSTVAFLIWGLASPGSWITDVVDISNDQLRTGIPLAIAVIGALVLAGMSAPLARKLPPTPQAP